MTTEWFNRKPGDFVSPSTEDPTMALVGNPTPDWVRLPAELGGQRARVKDAFVAPCACGGDHKVRHLVLGQYSVAECTQFLWYTTPKDKG